MKIIFSICIIAFTVFSPNLLGQNITNINLMPIDGIPLTPDNIFSYQIYCASAGNVRMNGTIQYRNSNLSFSYSFDYYLKQGLNTLSADIVHPTWQFSSSALQTLFFTYKILPEGTYEYCVTATPITKVKEGAPQNAEECLYYRAIDFFLINLIDPSNKEKIKEYNPLLSWVANYSFSNELTYRIRVAPIKQGQNASNAVLRNQPQYDESNLTQNSVIYPVYATPLVSNQWYAWMVNAYYHGILLGSSEAWQFIIPDTLTPTAKASRSFIDIKRENGINKLSALGDMKLKYVLDDAQTDSLYLQITNSKNKVCSLTPGAFKAKYGDNRYILNLADSASLKHNNTYTLTIKTKTKHEYKLKFQYINPEFTR